MVDQATSKAEYGLHPAVQKFAGEINDVDSHEATPTNLWVEQFGSAAKFLADAMFASNAGKTERNEKGFILASHREKDETEISPQTLRTSKMDMAPGAWDMGRRLEVIDYMGIRRQIMYPGSMALRSLNLYARADDKDFFKTITGDRRGLAKKAIAAYNEWVISTSQRNGRLRPAATLMEDTPEELIRSAKKLVGAGVRGLLIPTSRPPGGVSPAHPDLDPLWDLLSESGTPLLSHIGSDDDVLRTLVWRDAPAFEGWLAGEEFKFDPWTLSTFHLGVQNFVTAMVQGGVFERFPKLYLSCNEYGAHWIGPLAENMDMWQANQPFANEKGVTFLKMKPSEYVQRNVRVAPFYFEDVGLYIQRHGLEDVYCFGSDYPHPEGGKCPTDNFARNLEARGFGEDMMRKFFVENSKILFAD